MDYKGQVSKNRRSQVFHQNFTYLTDLQRNQLKTQVSIEMHPHKQSTVIAKAAAAGLEVMHIGYTNATNPNFCGNLVFMKLQQAETMLGYLSPMYFLRKT